MVPYAVIAKSAIVGQAALIQLENEQAGERVATEPLDMAATVRNTAIKRIQGVRRCGNLCLMIERV